MSNGNEATALGEALKQLVADRGLGAISKKDYELLVFHHLTKDPDLVGQSNYVLANYFKVTETRVKSLRLEASLRHQPADHNVWLFAIHIAWWRCPDGDCFQLARNGEVDH